MRVAKFPERLMVMIDPQTRRAIDQAATQERRSVGEVVRALLDAGLETQEAEECQKI